MQTATTDVARGGYFLMQALNGHLGTREPNIVGLSGQNAPSVSLEREGVKDR